LRYQGTDNAIMIERPENGNYREAFEAQYKREYGFLMPVSNFHMTQVVLTWLR